MISACCSVQISVNMNLTMNALIGLLIFSATLSAKVPKSKSKCCFQPSKVEYIGDQNTARTGEPCLPWNDSKIPKKLLSKLVKNTHSCEARENSDSSSLCRSVDNKIPKCVVKGGKLKPCKIPLCSTTRKNQLGLKYKGKMNKGKFLKNGNDRNSGIEKFACMRWDGKKQNPDVEIKVTPKKKNHNFCRNPDKDRNGPWCYKQNFVPTFDHKGKPLSSNYAYCDIQICADVVGLNKGC